MKKLLGKLFPSIQETLTRLLGGFWLLDGILQLQPQMFTKAFISNILEPNLPGQPSLIADLLHFGIHLYSINPIIMNSAAALIQIAIGSILLIPAFTRYRKAALAVSIAWGLGVWICGEGLGDIFTGSASFYTGAPGSVFLYLILAVFLLFDLPSYYLPQIAGTLFFLGAILNEVPIFWQKGMQAMLWQMSAQDSNVLISSPTKILSAAALTDHITNTILISMLLIFSIWLLIRPTKLLAWILIPFLFLVWWISQDFGGIFTFPLQTATDPNSAPLFILFLLPIFMQSKEVLSHTLFNKPVEGDLIEKFFYNKWFFACMLILIAILLGFVFNTQVHMSHTISNQSGMNMMSM